MFATFIALAAVLQVQESDENLLGWTVEPPAAVAGEETELDRLSRSKSGNSFGGNLFGGGADDSRIPISVTLRALDKITAEFTDLVLPIGEPAEYGALTIVPRTCSTRPPEEFPETSAFLEVYAGENDAAGARARSAAADELAPVESVEDIITRASEGESAPSEIQASIDEALFGASVFRGWMFASSPSINAMEHPTYDVWVIDCTMEDPGI